MSKIKIPFFLLSILSAVFLVFFITAESNKCFITIKYAVVISPELPFNEKKIKVSLAEVQKFLQEKHGIKVNFVNTGIVNFKDFFQRDDLKLFKTDFLENFKKEISDTLKEHIDMRSSELENKIVNDFLSQYKIIRSSMVVSKTAPYQFGQIVTANMWQKILEADQSYDMLIINEPIPDIIFNDDSDQNQNLYEFTTYNGLTSLNVKKIVISTFGYDFNLKYNFLIPGLPKDYFLIINVILHEVSHAIFNMEDKPYLDCIMNPYLDEYKVFSERLLFSPMCKNQIRAWKCYKKAQLYIKENPKRAIGELQKSLKHDNYYLPAIELLIEAYKKTNENNKVNEFENKLEISKKTQKESYQLSTKIISAYRKAVKFQNGGDYSEAIKEYKKIINFSYNSLDNKGYLQTLFLSALKNLGEIYFHMSNFKEAIYFLNQAIKIDSNNSNLYYLLGMCYLNENENRRAAEYFNYYLKLYPSGEKAEIIRSHLAEMKIRRKWGDVP